MWGADDPFVLKRLEGISTKPILSVANYLSLDADCIVAGSTDRSIRFYETVSMDEVMKTTMEKKNVSLVAVSGMSPEGDDPIIVTGGKDSVIQVWNPTASTPQHVIKLPTSEVKALAVYQGSRTLIAIGTRDSKVLIWDVGDDKLIATFEGHRASVYCICISVTSPDLEYTDDDMKSLCIASGGADRTVRTWDLVRGRRVKKFRHSRSISSIAVTNRGIRPLLASAGVERVIKIWDLDSGIQLRCLSGHLDQITTMTLWEGNQMFIISGSADHTIRIYDLISGECVCILKGHRDSVLSLTIADYDEPKIVSSSEDLSIIQWDLDAIISAFYDNSEDGEGARTPLPAYLPPVDYVAPAELDRSRLTKEERKRIRKERKKAKRLRNLQSFNAGKKSTRSSISNNNNNNNNDEDDDDDLENYGSFVFDDDDDQDLAPEDEEPVVPPMISIPEAIKQAVEAVNDAMKATEEEILPAEPTKTPSKASLLRVVSNKVLPADAPAESSLQSVAGGLIKGILNRVFHTGQHNKVGIEPFPARDPSTDTDITPPTMESESTSIKKKSDETGVDDDNAATIDKDATTSREDGVEESKSIAATGFEAVHATATAVVETTLAISIPTPSKPLIVGEDSGHNMVEYKSITRMKQESFSMAVADHKRETDRMKSQASEKLRNRLIMKQMRNSVGPFSPNSTEGGPTETDTTKGNGEGTGDANGNAPDGGGEVIDAAAKSEFMRVKAEKLRQHKMQEMRRKESMMVSKNRSGLALQKRLEDLKTKRMQQAAEGGAGNKNDLVEMADEGEDDDDDDDNNSDNEAS